MPKVLILTDCHWGCRNDSSIFLDNISKFYREIVFPKIDELGINNVIHCGDLVDRRKFINFSTLNRMRKEFIQPLIHRRCHLHIVPGNHDMFGKHTMAVNAPREILPSEREGFFVYDKPKELCIRGQNFLMLPWICAENEKETLDAIAKSPSRVALGHLELSGFDAYRGQHIDHGQDPAIFRKFEQVYSGHYHHPSEKDNVKYLGATREIVWSDWDDLRGCHILDVDTFELEFVRNPFTMFEKVTVEEAGDKLDRLKDKIVRVVVERHTDPVRQDAVVKKLQEAGVVSVQTIDRQNPKSLETVLLEDVDTDDTLSMLADYADNGDVACDRQDLKKLLTELYQDASHLEV